MGSKHIYKIYILYNENYRQAIRHSGKRISVFP